VDVHQGRSPRCLGETVGYRDDGRLLQSEHDERVDPGDIGGGGAPGTGARTHGYGSGTVPCAPRGNFASVSPGMFRCADTSLGGRWASQLASETSS
jgi:hypothetical protein